jgi:hypothetical protein
VRKALLLAAIAGVGVGCASSGTEDWRKVRITKDPESVRGCQFMATITDSSLFGSGSVEEDMLKKTAKAGGNVLLEKQLEGVSGSGEAYRCEPAKP